MSRADKAKQILEDIITGILAEKGVRVGLTAGLVNGLIFFFLYLLLGVKVLPIGLLSFAREIFFISFFMVEGAIFGLLFGILYDIIPIKSNFYKAITLSLTFWFIVKIVPYNPIMFEKPLVLVETLVRYLLKGTLVSVFWKSME